MCVLCACFVFFFVVNTGVGGGVRCYCSCYHSYIDIVVSGVCYNDVDVGDTRVMLSVLLL